MVSIRGPNYGISPNSGIRNPEEVLFPPATESNAIFKLKSSNVSIDGFTLNGDNVSIITGWPGKKGADIDAYEGIVYYDPANTLVVNNVSIENNIIENFQFVLSGSQIGVNYTLKTNSYPFFFGPTKAETGDTIQFITPAQIGEYYFEAVNASTSCTVEMNGTAIIGISIPPSAEVSNQVNPSCNTYEDGSFDVVVTEGYAPFTYSLNGGGFVSYRVFSGLSDGSYSVTIIDGNGCTTSVEVTSTEPVAVVLITTKLDAVFSPEVVDLTDGSVNSSSEIGLTNAYYSDESATTQASNPTEVSLSGTYYSVGTTGAGCSDMASVNVVANQPSSSVTTETACDSLEWNGQWYYASGSYQYVTTNAAGCDSIATLELTINKHSEVTLAPVIACDSYTFGDSTYTESTTVIEALTNQAGYDSIQSFELTIHYSTSSVPDEVACDSLE